MSTPYIRQLKRHYRNTWIGTGLGIVFVLFLIGLGVEIHFSSRYFGVGSLAGLAFKMAAAPTFLVLLILRDQKGMTYLDKFRFTLLAALVAGVICYWGVAFTNRAWRGSQYQYFQTVLLEKHTPKYASRFGNAQAKAGVPPDHYAIQVRDENNKIHAFTTAKPLFSTEMIGKKVALPVIRGRWGQDFIAVPE
ncbi:MAG: hypothetical protein AAF828_07155 [Bacteroidota bacterium]